MAKLRYLVGIDPGTKTGFAIWDRQEKTLSVISTTTIITAMAKVLEWADSVELRIEDARQRMWFGSAGRERLKGVGSVNRDCTIWETFCKHHKIKYTMIAPKNTTTKLPPDRFKKITGWEGRTSEHGRDAAMLVFGA